MKEQETERVYTFRDIEEHPRVKQFGLTTRICERAYRRGDLVGFKPGLVVIFPASAVDAWLDNSRTDAK